MTESINLVSLIEKYGDDAKCREALEKIRWPDGVGCPRCGDMSVSELREYDKWDCNSCRYQFTVTAGTIMHRSHLPLFKWFLAIYLMPYAQVNTGIAAYADLHDIEVERLPSEDFYARFPEIDPRRSNVG